MLHISYSVHFLDRKDFVSHHASIAVFSENAFNCAVILKISIPTLNNSEITNSMTETCICHTSVLVWGGEGVDLVNGDIASV